MAEYCNITDDLQRVFVDIENFQARDIVEGWTVISGTVYKKSGVGYVSTVFLNQDMMALASSAPSPLSSLSEDEWYYDADLDMLYVNTGEAPSGITVGEDWDAFKTICRNEAQDFLDSMLSGKYATPLQPRSRQVHTDDTYDFVIKDATACLTCWKIIARTDPQSVDGLALFKRVYNSSPGDGEDTGYVQKLLNDELFLRDQITVRELSLPNVFPSSSNTATIEPIFDGTFTGSDRRHWRLEIDTLGARGVATYKVSYDGGTNWDLTKQDTHDSDTDEYRFYIASGIYVYWPSQDYALEDKWDLEFVGQDQDASSSVFNIEAHR